jgi:hypothetical protein
MREDNGGEKHQKTKVKKTAKGKEVLPQMRQTLYRPGQIQQDLPGMFKNPGRAAGHASIFLLQDLSLRLNSTTRSLMRSG